MQPPTPLKSKDTPAARQDSAKQALAVGLELTRNAVRARTLEDVQFILANDTRALLPFDRSALVLHIGGSSSVAAVNNQYQLDPKSEFVKKVTDLVPDIKEVKKGTILVANASLPDTLPEATAKAVKAYMEWSGLNYLVLIPLSVYDNVIGHLWLEFFDQAKPGETETLTLMNMVPFLSSALAEKWLITNKKSFRTTYFGAVAGASRLSGFVRAGVKAGVIVAMACLLVLGLSTPVALKVKGKAEVAPEYENHAFVEIDGVVDKILVGMGSRVTRGQVLATLDPEELDYQIGQADILVKSFTAEIEILRNLGAEDSTKLAESRLIEIKRLRAKEKLDFLNRQRRLLEVRSPVDGVVLTEKLEGLVGKRFKAGEAFCLIAPDEALLVEIFTHESDIAYVRVGQRAQVFFNHEPDTAYDLVVKSIAPKAEAMPRVGNVFRVRAAFAARPPEIRPGTQGLAHISTIETTVWFMLTRRLVTKLSELSLFF